MFTRFTKDSQFCEMVLLVAIATPNLAMMKSYFLLCRIFPSPGAAKTSLQSQWLAWREILHILGPISLLSFLIMPPREQWKKVQVCLHRSYCWGQPLNTDWLLYPFTKVDSLIEYICGLFSIPKMGNLLHMIEFSTLGMVLLDGIPSEGLKASRFLCAHSSTRKLMYLGLPRRDNAGSLTIAASLNAVILPLSP